MRKELRDHVYTFMLIPFGGMLKKVEHFTVKYNSSTDARLYSNSDPDDIIPLWRVEAPYKKGKVFFLLMSILFPLVIFSVIYLIGIRYLYYFDKFLFVAYSFLYFVATTDILLDILKMRKYSFGFDDAIKYDNKKIFGLLFTVTVMIVAGLLVGKVNFVTITSFVILVTWYIVFKEMIKKSLLILLSSRIIFWEFEERTANHKKKLLITPEIKE